MNNALVINYDPFAKESRVMIVNNNLCSYATVASNIDDLAKEVVNLAYSKEIYEIKSHAPSAITDEIRQIINELENTNYSTNKITVEEI